MLSEVRMSRGGEGKQKCQTGGQVKHAMVKVGFYSEQDDKRWGRSDSRIGIFEKKGGMTLLGLLKFTQAIIRQSRVEEERPVGGHWVTAGGRQELQTRW